MTTYSLDAVAPRDRLAYWLDVICDTMVEVDARPLLDGERFHGQVRAGRLGDLRLARVSAAPQQVLRSPRQIAKARQEAFVVDVQLAGGSVVAQDGREALVAPGDFVLYDSTRPYSLRPTAHSGSMEHLVLLVPRTLLDARCSGLDAVTGTPVRACGGLGQLASSYVTALARTADGIEPALTARLAETALDLLAAAFATALGDPSRLEPSALRSAHMQRIRSYVEAHLGEPDLSPARVAAAAHISTRYLHKLFAAEGGTTFNRWLKERRLERCRRDLVDPRYARRTVTDVAFAWGFHDLTQFGRAFRERYGQSPTEYRESGLTDFGPRRVAVPPGSTPRRRPEEPGR